MQDGYATTESMMAHANQTNATPENAWVQVDLGGSKKLLNEYTLFKENATK